MRRGGRFYKPWRARAVRACTSPPVRLSVGPGRGRSSGVEHNLAKVGVEGSNPSARSSSAEAKRLRRIGSRVKSPALAGFCARPLWFVSVLNRRNRLCFGFRLQGLRVVGFRPKLQKIFITMVYASEALVEVGIATDGVGELELNSKARAPSACFHSCTTALRPCWSLRARAP